ncbi:hypothetical protein JCM19238_231 [Vibrio ponticus]|nr:hypothetical protein JCM19238_231 [Vibrio ponticus]
MAHLSPDVPFFLTRLPSPPLFYHHFNQRSYNRSYALSANAI